MRRLLLLVVAGLLAADGYVLASRVDTGSAQWSTVMHAVSPDGAYEARLVGLPDGSAWLIRLHDRRALFPHDRVVWRSTVAPDDVRFDPLGYIDVREGDVTSVVMLP